jgi:hypothetical protein
MATRFERVGALALVGSALCIALATAPAKAQCVGDCNNMGTVQINELILGVSISLGMQPIDACPSFDCAGTGTVPINCLIQGVNNSLSGCPATPTVTEAATATATVSVPTSTATVALPTSTATVELPTSTATVELPTSTATVEAPTATATIELPTATATATGTAAATATATATGTAAATATPTATGGEATPTATMMVVGCGNNVVEDDEECDGTDTGICPDGAECFPSGDDNECECAPASCTAIDVNSGGTATSGTFTVMSTGAPQAGDKYCGGTAIANAFEPCTADAECGGSPCVAIPWLGVATFAPFPITSVSTTFTAGAPDAKCVHPATVPCVGLTDPCPGTPKLGAGNPCCTDAGFKVDTFFIAALGFCSRVDQTACGGGVVDTSVPMLGDYDIEKVADTTPPMGPNCSYNGTEDHGDPGCVPPEDSLGQVVTTIGDGAFDAAGGHSRFSIPQRSVTWVEMSTPPCSPTDLFDGNDNLITSFNLQLGTTTATSTAAYLDSPNDNDTVAFCGFGPGSFNAIAAGKPDLPGEGSLTAAVGAALSGGAPTYDLLFSSLSPLTSPVLVADQPACTPEPPGCPE